jgi:hypothetical protein
LSYIKANDTNEQEMFDFLEDLRQSGETNMFGAGPYLKRAFNITTEDAHRILSAWMKGHNDPARKLDKPTSKVKTTVKFRTVADVETESR